MKRLKYSCPFGGKVYPFYLALASVFVPTIGMLFTDINPFFQLVLMFACPLAVLTACFFMNQNLTSDEREICAATELPLWLPANPALAAAVRERVTFPNEATLYAVLFSVICGGNLLLPRMSGGSLSSALVCCLAPAGIFVTFQLIHVMIWRTLDETAVYTIIPIDHMYDVKHTGKHGRVWYESYLVFYQPDGRYTLHAKTGDGSANCVVIVKHRGLVTWLPYKEERTLM